MVFTNHRVGGGSFLLDAQELRSATLFKKRMKERRSNLLLQYLSYFRAIYLYGHSQDIMTFFGYHMVLLVFTVDCY